MTTINNLPTVVSGAIQTVPTPSDLPVTEAIGAERYSISNSTVYTFDGSSWTAISGGGGGSGTVTSVSVTTANGVSGNVTNPTTTPAISLTLGAITPSSVASVGTVTASNVSGSTSGTNTGDQTITLTSDVTGSGTGSFATTVASVGGSSAANVHAAELAANAATSANTASTIVKRDASGNFTAGTITASLTGTASGNPPNARSVATSAPLTGGGDLSADRTLGITQATTSTDGYLSATDWNTFNNKQAGGVAITSLTSDVSASGPGAAAATVNSVGGSSAANVHSAELLANAATSANTASAIVKRDASGNFSAGTITANLTGTASGNVAPSRSISTSAPLSGGGDLSADRIISISQSTTSTDGYLSSTDWNTFNNKQSTSQKGAANGYAGLDAGGKVPASQLPSTLMNFKGAWDAAANSPTLADGTGSNGDVYRASTAGTQNLGSGAQTWAIGDWAIYNGSIWQHSPGTDAVTSVNSFTGAVSLTTTNIPQGTNLYFTAGAAQTAVVVPTISSGDTAHASSSDALFTALSGKQATGSYMTALTSDVSASGPGSAAATVNSVGGSSAVNIHNAELAANAATSANTASAIVKRDSSGNFIAGTITAALTGTASGNPPNARTISTSAPLSGGGDLSADRTLSISQSTTSTNGYLSSTDWNTFNGKQAAGSYITALTGDVSASGPGSASATLAAVGTAGTYVKVTTDSKGRVTSGSAAPLGISDGGTNSTTALVSGRTIVSSAGAIVESAITSTELNALSGISSNIQTQLGGKAATTTTISTSAPLTGGGDLSANRTLSIPAATASVDGYLSATDFTSFSGKLTSPLTTKGDILGYSTVNARVPVGTDGQVLTADSGQTLGVKWSTPTASSSTANIRPSEGAGTTTFTSADNHNQVFNLSADRICILPTTGVGQGEIWTISNPSKFTLTVRASDASDITLINGMTAQLAAKIATPVTNTDWTAVAQVSTVAVGKVMQAYLPYGSRVSLTSGSYYNINTLTLSAGTWLISTVTDFTVAGAFVGTLGYHGVSLTSASLATDDANYYGFTSLASLSATVTDQTESISNALLTITTPTTIYQVARANFSAGIMDVYGRLNALKVSI